MCGCDRYRGYLCPAHERQEAIINRRRKLVADAPDPAPKPRPVDTYLARIRAGQD